MTVNFALLGAGRIGKVHAKAIAGNADARLVAVSDAFAEAAQTVADTYGCAVRGIEDVEADKSIDAVVILHADRHTCGFDRALCPRRQGRFL